MTDLPKPTGYRIMLKPREVSNKTKGGIILTDDENAAKMLKLMSYDGRDLSIPYNDPNHIKTMGYHMYMTPEDAARGIILMDNVPEENEDSGSSNVYPDVEEMIKNI